ncbi:MULTISPECIES: hypothetical protein [Oleiagrimonas]|jgi:hypothetical protein|uniref:Bacteriophage CI repressor n=1 Tax=Oleiagrimonas citrea TaxID=1665687 RepID=A0A846ZMU9_9GAMM|nr:MULTISPECIES: hypothetical protein [Oleiagrimonas]NKZ39625.1 hypothetical protein [Oleiagrimonas citrea]RAP59413.1 hypothetical protein BTJ49_01760 [Oleiagrimonas sp. MCCC 1A03011]
MSATIELFELFKERLTVRSDHAAGQILGVKPQTISNWRTRGSQAEPKLIETMCRKLEQDPMPWLLRAQADQAHDPANGLVWKRMATRLGISLTAVALAVSKLFSDANMQMAVAMGGMDEYAWGAMSSMSQALTILS